MQPAKAENNVMPYPNQADRQDGQSSQIQDHATNEEQNQDSQVGTVKFVVQGLEMLDKQVKQSGNSGRIYLPPHWVGKRVKIIRMD